MEQASIRRATKGDVDQIADLVVRLKKLNNEFDPLFTVKDDAKETATKYISESLGPEKVIVLAVTKGKKVIGFLRGELTERLFYEPSKEGIITDMYVLPEHRRNQLGQDLLEQATTELRKMGAQIIAADLPTRNEIGVHFYSKRGFRRLTETFAHVAQ